MYLGIVFGAGEKIDPIDRALDHDWSVLDVPATQVEGIEAILLIAVPYHDIHGLIREIDHWRSKNAPPGIIGCPHVDIPSSVPGVTEVASPDQGVVRAGGLLIG